MATGPLGSVGRPDPRLRQQIAWTLPLMDLATDVASCRPAGRYVQARQGVACPRSFLRRTCHRPKYCPWCHYRRISDGWNGLSGLYDQVAYFAALPDMLLTLVKGWALGTLETVSGLREKLRLKVKRTVKPEAFWLVCRPNLHRTHQNQRPTYELAVLVAGPRELKLKFPKGITPNQTSWQVCGPSAPRQMIPRFYPYQAGLIRSRYGLETLEAFYRANGTLNPDTDRYTGMVDLAAQVPDALRVKTPCQA